LRDQNTSFYVFIRAWYNFPGETNSGKDFPNLSSLKRFWDRFSTPIFLLVLCYLAFGILIPSLGFYWDDWPMIWFAKTQGALGFPAAFSGDRPFLAMIYVLTTSVLKIVPYQWQILGLLVRWMTVLAAWWSLKQLWPQAKAQTAWMAILLAVYPGFKQQPISVVYGNGLVLLASYFLSYGLMTLAIIRPKKRWLFLILSIITYGFCLLSTEYYIGLDLIRGVWLWIFLRSQIPDIRKRICTTLAYWSPFIFLLGGFMVWRVFVFKFPTYQPILVETFSKTPLSQVLHLLFRIIRDSFNSGWIAWAETFRFPTWNDFQIKSSLFNWGLVIFSLILIYLFLGIIKKPTDQDAEVSGKRKTSHEMILLGGLALLFAGWPYWITDLPVELTYPYDRFNLAFMLGSVILVVGLIDWIIHTHTQKIILISIIASMAIGANFLNDITYRREWAVHNDFFRQLSWRAPALKSGTLIITKSLPLEYYSDNSLTAPLNLIYAPDNNSLNLSYYFAFLDVRLGRSIPAFQEGLPVVQGYRNASFTSTTSQSLVLFYSPPGCLRILDPARDHHLPVLPSEYENVMDISHINQIIPGEEPSATLPESIFGVEPAHTWCYYFEKADLALQQNSWDQVAALGDQAFAQGFSPGEPSEILVFIEGYANAGQLEKALDLTTQVFAQSPNLQPKLCESLQRIQTNQAWDETSLSSIITIKNHLDCDYP
jgi:hypothetical protein